MSNCDVIGGPVGLYRTCRVAKLPGVGSDWPKRNTRRSVITNFDKSIARATDIAYCQTYSVITGRNVDTENSRPAVAVKDPVLSCQTWVYFGVPVCNDQAVHALLVTESQTITSGWIRTVNHVRLIRPIGHKTGNFSKVKSAYNDRRRRGAGAAAG